MVSFLIYSSKKKVMPTAAGHGTDVYLPNSARFVEKPAFRSACICL
ncbi:hypothetical protein M2447_002467 [Ereboglobus sp. PH5-10]|nr:hypothetical protein [Ereboglobus sp. PH5-10]